MRKTIVLIFLGALILFSAVFVVFAKGEVQSDDVKTVFSSTKQPIPWTVMVYLDGDNNLGSPYGNNDFSELENSVAHVNIVVLKDGNVTGGGDTELYYIFDGVETQFNPGNPAWFDAEEEMSDDSTLEDFVTWALNNYPANHYLLCLWDHGSSWEGCCQDETSNDNMLRLSEIKTALGNSLAPGQKLDIIAFADCLMANTEVCYELHDYADYLIGSELTGWLYGEDGYNWDFDDIVEYMETHQNPVDVCSYIVNNALDLKDNMKSESHTWAAIDLNELPNLAADIDAFSNELINAFLSCYIEIITARMNTVWTNRNIDLYQFAENINTDLALPVNLRARAQNVINSIGTAVIAEAHYTGTEGKPTEDAHGLTIYFPNSKANNSSHYPTTNYAEDFTDDTLWDESFSLYLRYLFVDVNNTDFEDGTLWYPYNTLQEAVDGADEGDTLRVFQGTYGPATINKTHLNVIGNGSTVTIIDGAGYDICLWLCNDSVSISNVSIINSDKWGVYITANYTFTKNCTISNISGDGVYIEGRNNSISSCVVQYNRNGVHITDNNNTVEDCNIYFNNGGIYASYSDKNSITNNSIQNNTYDGISLDCSNNNIIDNNVIRDNNDTGMHLYSSQGNTISNCSFYNNGYGLLLDYSSSNKLIGNVLKDNDYNFGVNGSEEKDFYQDVNISNTIDEKPIYYFVNQTNLYFSVENSGYLGFVNVTDTGYIGLINVTNAKIENANIWHNIQGILTAYSSNIEIKYSTFTNNTCSMYILQSTNVTVDHCIVGGSFVGIGVYGGYANTVSNNTVSGNEHGIAIGISYFNKIVENDFSFNSHTGIYLYMASFNIVGYNVFERLGGSICGFDSHWDMINNNNLSAGGHIRMEYCSNETIANNTISESDVDAIYFDNTHNCILTNNTISKTAAGQLSGIKLHASNGNIIESDNKIYSNYYGIYLDASKENEILGNDIYFNAYGIYIVEQSIGNHINWNQIHGNSVVGVYVPREVTETVDAEDNWWGNYTGPYDNHNDTIDGGDYNSYGTGDNVTDYVDYRPWLYMNPKTLYIIMQMYASGELVVINATKLKMILFINTSSENKSAEKLITEKYLKIVIVEYESNPSRDESIPEGMLHLGNYFEIHISPLNRIKLPIYVKIFYAQDELDRIGVDENRISGIYSLDELTNQWQQYNNTDVNTTDTMGYAGYVWAYMDVLGSIGIFAFNDTAAPTITHIPIVSWRNNTAIVINATIIDDMGIESVVLFYRKATERTYVSVQMSSTSRNVWTGTIPASAVTSVGLEYYIWATDGKNNVTTPVYTVTVPITTASIIEGREVRVYYNGTGNLTARNVTANERETLRMNLPASRGDIGLFIDVNITGVFRDAFITIQYNDSDLAGADETTLRMYYWNETTNEWTLIPDSGVWTNNNTVWAMVTHLTIFAPMAEKVTEGITPAKEGVTQINWVFYISAVVAMATVIIIGIIAVLRKRK